MIWIKTPAVSIPIACRYGTHPDAKGLNPPLFLVQPVMPPSDDGRITAGRQG
jgi:hypothetical protein